MGRKRRDRGKGRVQAREKGAGKRKRWKGTGQKCVWDEECIRWVVSGKAVFL